MDQIEKSWDAFSSVYDESSNTVAPATLQLWTMLKVRDADTMIECGCGPGYMLPFLINIKKSSAKVVAFDLSSEMVRISINRLKSLGYKDNDGFFADQNITVRKGNSEQLDLPDESFDVFSSSLVLHLTESPSKMLQEARRVLKPNGRIGCSVWGSKENSSVMTIVNKVFLANGIQQPTPSRTPFHLNDQKALIQLLEENGFEQVGTPFSWTSIMPFAVFEEQDLSFLLDGPRVKDFVNSLSPELQTKIRSDLFEEIKLMNERHETLQLEILSVIAKRK